MDEKIRINKYLSDAGVCSRREADRLTEAGRVTVRGTVVSTGEKIFPDEEICIDGKPIKKQEKKILLLFHKPRGIVCSTKQQRNEMTVTEYLNYPVRIYPVGRLDKESEGLLLLTNQGDLVNRIMKAGNYHEKEYCVTVNKPVTEAFIQGMSSGVPILGTVTRPCKVIKTGKNSFRIILTQGLNRQIRRMCEYFGYKVTTLKRVRIMNLHIDGLEAGKYREIRPEERKQLEEMLSSAKTERKTEEGHERNIHKKNERAGKKLREASRAYYQEDREIMPNVEYDALYDELSALEEETGIVLADSPTVNVGYEAVDQLPKEEHERPMLSLDKTKDREALREFVGEHPTLLSWKLDGLTIVLTYENGELVKAVTRGNGIVGEVITNNARVFKNIPLKISFRGRLVLRGEAIITYSDFEKINETIGDADAKYKNPRNLCSGSVRQLNNEITAKRNVRFYAFSLVSAEGVDFQNSREVQFQWLNAQGFDVVEYRKVTADTLDEAMDYFAEAVTKNDFPSDGLVALYDNIAYGESLGTTAKFPRNAMAFKWADEMRDTKLLEIEWSPSRTGLINPVAVFEPVELEGTTVSRASVHNISIMKELKLGIGDTIRVYKANMIIPQIAENLTGSGNAPVPHICPACGQETVVKKENDVECLFCVNPGCPAKKIKSFGLFTSRDAMNIDGLSEATLEKFIARGFIHDFGDIFEINRYRDEIVEMEGFGQKSYDNLIESLERAKETTLPRVIYSLGIANIGLANAKVICRYFNNDLEKIRHASLEEISEIDTIGPVIAGNLVSYFQDEENNRRLDHLMSFLHIQDEGPKQEQIFAGMNFVITGSLVHFGNRSEAKELIESLGGKVTGSVTKKTNYLINNDIQSSSSKNKKARELGIPILSEEDFLNLVGKQ